jgi:ubiquinone/menaquinone biosynthesis C-methylase UbiE
MKEYSSQKIFEKIIEHADIENQEILEIGCGDGRITSLMAGKPKTLVAIDPDEEKIKEARSNIGGVDFQIGSGERTLFPTSRFDLVVFTLSLHHQNSRKAIAEAARVLKDDGKILVVEPVIEGEIEQLFALLYDENEDKIEAQNAIIKSGLCLERSEIFEAEWVFEDKDDLLKSTFEYYDMPFDLKIASEMLSLFKEKIKINPIVLTDLMVIQSLKKYTAKT